MKDVDTKPQPAGASSQHHRLRPHSDQKTEENKVSTSPTSSRQLEPKNPCRKKRLCKDSGHIHATTESVTMKKLNTAILLFLAGLTTSNATAVLLTFTVLRISASDAEGDHDKWRCHTKSPEHRLLQSEPLSQEQVIVIYEEYAAYNSKMQHCSM